MFYQTYTARASRRQRAMPSPHHPSPATEWCRLLLIAANGVRRTPYHALSTGVTEQFFVFLSLVTLTFDLWRWHSNSSERGTKHVFPVNLAQICSAVPGIFEAQTKWQTKSQTALKGTFTCVRWRTENKIDFEHKHAHRQVAEWWKSVKWASENLRYVIITQESKTEQNVPLAPPTESVNTNFNSPLETSVWHNHLFSRPREGIY